jgi:hypothetical protein
MIGAGLYMWTAYLYPDTYTEDVTGVVTMRIHTIETTAAAIEVLAALGWLYSWWVTFPRRVPGRGWTFDDPDLWGLIFIIAPSLLYLHYNVSVITDLASYATNDSYVVGNAMYAIGRCVCAYVFAHCRTPSTACAVCTTTPARHAHACPGGALYLRACHFPVVRCTSAHATSRWCIVPPRMPLPSRVTFLHACVLLQPHAVCCCTPQGRAVGAPPAASHDGALPAFPPLAPTSRDYE